VAWSPDGEWMYFSSDAGSRFHIWRQRFAGGEAEQITSGATEEERIAVVPDGRSLNTSVGMVQSTVVVHDAQGDREVSSESYAQAPQFSADGKYAFYLVAMRGAGGHRFISGELFRVDIGAGANERLLSGFLMTAYAISPDGKRVVLSTPDRQEHCICGSPTSTFVPLRGNTLPGSMKTSQISTTTVTSTFAPPKVA